VDSPLHVKEIAPSRYRVDGSPADCVRLALKVLKPVDVDWVIAGINPGANLGSDIYQSGTVAAAREAAILGGTGMAVSQYISENGTIDWQATGAQAARIITEIMGIALPERAYWNINLPHPIATTDTVAHKLCDPDPYPHAYGFRREGDLYTYEGSIHRRPRESGKDVAVCFDEHCISVSQLHV
jgi:5'-nucleotidase